MRALLGLVLAFGAVLISEPAVAQLDRRLRSMARILVRVHRKVGTSVTGIGLGWPAAGLHSPGSTTTHSTRVIAGPSPSSAGPAGSSIGSALASKERKGVGLSSARAVR